MLKTTPFNIQYLTKLYPIFTHFWSFLARKCVFEGGVNNFFKA